MPQGLLLAVVLVVLILAALVVLVLIVLVVLVLVVLVVLIHSQTPFCLLKNFVYLLRFPDAEPDANFQVHCYF